MSIIPFFIISSFYFITSPFVSGKEYNFGLDSNWTYYWPIDSTKQNPRFSCISFADSLNGVIGANMLHDTFSPSIIRTTDGGKTWLEVLRDSTTFYEYDSTKEEYIKKHRANQLRDIAYIDTNLCIAVMTDASYTWTPYFVTSTDKGNSWSHTYLPERNMFNRIVFNKKKQGFIFGESGYVLTTLDTGKSWQQITFPDSIIKYIWDMKFFNDTTFLFFTKKDSSYFIGNDEYFKQKLYVNKTTNNGKTWNTNECPTEVLGQMKLCFINEKEGWFGGYGTLDSTYRSVIIYHTTNSGKTWEKQLDTVNNKTKEQFWVINLKFYDKLNGIFASFNSDLFLTSDGGKNWVEQVHKNDSLMDINFNDITFVNIDLIFGLEEHGFLFRYERKRTVRVAYEMYLFNNQHYLNLYPNPKFSYQILRINYFLENYYKIKIELVNNLGIKVSDIYTGWEDTGEHTLQFTLEQSLPSGIYWVRMIIDGKEQIVKSLLIIN